MDRERRFGITTYANSCEGFVSVMKHRYTDFIVHEISSMGEKAQLTNMGALQADEDDTKDEIEDSVSEPLSSDAKKQNLLDILQIDFPDLVSCFSVFLSSEMTDPLQIQVATRKAELNYMV